MAFNYKTSADRSEQRTCFGILWYATIREALEAEKQIIALGLKYNGGWADGTPCGREPRFDKHFEGKLYYACTY